MKLRFRTILLLFTLLSLGNSAVKAQLQFPGSALGINSHLKAAEIMYVLPPVDPFEVEAELELNRMTNSKPLRFALERPLSLSPEAQGSWTLEGDVRVWRVHIVSPGAYSLGVVFNRYALLPGVKLFVYDPGEQQVKGAFTSENNKDSGILPVGHIPGDEVVIEMQVPSTLGSYGDLEVEMLSHAYLNTGFKSSTADCPAGEFDCSLPCEIDVNCTEGDEWWSVKPSVVRIYTTTLWCTGVLVNNTSYDGTPYIITAEHCINIPLHADRSVFLFNYQSADCFGEDGPHNMSIAGADLITVGDSLDFSLVELSELPPASYDVRYAGWDRSDFQNNSTATIHHPFGDVKKISFDYDAPFIPDNPGDVPYNGLEDYHYFSYWWIKRWDMGTTEGGSSGCPLFNQDRKVIGTLSGGVAECGDSIGYDSDTDRVIFNLAPNKDDYYTRFSMAWDYEEAKGNALKTWLDPLNLNYQSIGEYNPTSIDPVKVESGGLFLLFPNPAQELFHITAKEPLNGRGEYTIINLSGAIVERGYLDGEGHALVYTSQLSPGLYIVNVGFEGHREYHKLMVTG